MWISRAYDYQERFEEITMAGKGNTSKLARALAKDLRGEQVIYRNFKEGEISILRDENKKNRVSRRGFFGWGLLWKIVLVIFIINISMFLYFKEYKHVGITKGLNGLMATAKTIVPDKVQTTRLIAVKADNASRQEKILTVKKGEDAACMFKKSAYGNTGFTLEKEFHFARSCLQANSKKIYCWDDEQGITHFSNKGFPSAGYFLPKWVRHR
jgi:hypothetical protein